MILFTSFASIYNNTAFLFFFGWGRLGVMGVAITVISIK